MNKKNRVLSLLIRSMMAVLLGIGLALLLNTESVAGDVKLEEIKTKTDLYQNVTVTGHNDTDIFLVHSRGMANVKIKDLDPYTLWRVGLGEKPLEPGSPEAIAAAEAKANEGKMPAAIAKMLNASSLPLAERPESEQGLESGTQPALPMQFKPNPAAFKAILPILLGIAMVGLLFYLFACYCLKLIVQKTGTEPGLMIWLPILQLIPLLRAAGMSLVWFFMWISPLFVAVAMPLIMFGGNGADMAQSMSIVSMVAAVTSLLQLVAALVWCVKIVQARGKSLWVTLFLILPVTNLFAFLYLAFSDSDYDGSETDNRSSDSDRIVIEPVFGEA